MPRQPSWTDEQLIEAVASATCFKQVCDALDLRPGAGTYRTLERHMARLGIDFSHLARRLDPASRRSSGAGGLTTELAGAVGRERVMDRPGEASRLREPSGGIHRFIKAHVVQLSLDTSPLHQPVLGQGPEHSQASHGPAAGGRSSSSARRYTTQRRSGSASSPEGLRRRRSASCAVVSRLAGRAAARWSSTTSTGTTLTTGSSNLRILCPNCHSLDRDVRAARPRAAVVVPVEGFEPSLTAS